MYKEDRNALIAAIEGASNGEIKKLPGMFDSYLSRIPKEGLEYIGTIQNGNNLEAGIVVELAKIDKDQTEKRIASVKTFMEKYPSGITLAAYKARVA